MKQEKFKINTVEGYLINCLKDVKSIAIVMNGVIKNDNEEAINNSDVVFRFNLFKLAGCQHLVGNKTSHWFVNGHHSLASHQNRIALCPFPADKYTITERIEYKNKGKILYAANDYRKYVPSDIMYPTTGYIAMILLLKTFKHNFTIYGMDGLTSGHYWDGQHKHAKKHSKHSEVEYLEGLYNDRLLWA